MSAAWSGMDDVQTENGEMLTGDVGGDALLLYVELVRGGNGDFDTRLGVEVESDASHRMGR